MPPALHFQRTYLLGDDYPAIQARAAEILGKHWDDPAVLAFDDQQRSLTFTSEQIIPQASTGRQRVLLLFSNPHPRSIAQGMFLAPNARGQENPFWPVMAQAGWLPIPPDERRPHLLAPRCLQADYPGPFELVFHCYYAFPTPLPRDLRSLFGQAFFDQVIQPQAEADFAAVLAGTGVEAVVTFNKEIYNRAASQPVAAYIQELLAGKLVHSQVRGHPQSLPIFLTYPTGWRYHPAYRARRAASLEAIRAALA